MSVSEADEVHIRRTLTLAREAATRGDNPFGSLLVHDEEVLAEAKNSVVTENDVTAHPEHDLARVAARELGPAANGATLYTSTEPCPMCAGALYHAGVGRIVYSASAEDVRDIVGPGLLIPCSDIFAAGSREVIVDGPVLQDAGRRVHQECW
jgi:tRNA(Arg) A34 adenosine deaminase TadA